MSTASQRLTTLRNHLQLPNMAAASNFYSIVAGVGAGTGTYSLFSLSITLFEANSHVNRPLSRAEIRKDLPGRPSCPQLSQLRIHR